MMMKFSRTTVQLASVAMALMLACQTVAIQAQTVAPAARTTTARTLPGDSVYQLDIALQDQNGRKFSFASRAGRVSLVSMFYNSCEYVCPMLIDTLQLTQNALSKAEADKLAIFMVSFDPARDDVASLKGIEETRKLPAASWTLARGEEDAVRPLAAVLGIQYRQLESGEFNHTSQLILLSADGRILAKTSQLSQVDPEFLKQIRIALHAAP